MSKTQFNKLDLLLKEIEDPYVQENFYRLKLFLEAFDAGDDTYNVVTNVVNNIIGSTAIWEKANGTVSASTTSVEDTIPLVDFNSVKYILSFSNGTNSEVKHMEVGVVNLGTSIKDSVYGKVKGSLNVHVNAVYNSPNFELEIINNETFSIEYDLAKLIF